MARGARLLLKNSCYHIMIRGNQKQKVFFDEEDYKIFLQRLKKYKKRYNFFLYGYCLMPNHVHMIGCPKQTDELARFMKALSISYVHYFNDRYKKVGHLWQGRFKSKVVMKDEYLLDCVNYIEQNPLRSNLSPSIATYKWSSYKERVIGDNGKSDKILDEIVL